MCTNFMALSLFNHEGEESVLISFVSTMLRESSNFFPYTDMNMVVGFLFPPSRRVDDNMGPITIFAQVKKPSCLALDISLSLSLPLSL